MNMCRLELSNALTKLDEGKNMKLQRKTLTICVISIALVIITIAAITFPGITHNIIGQARPFETNRPGKDMPISDEHRDEYEIKHVSALLKNGIFKIPVASSDGVILDYDEENFFLEGIMQYGIFTVAVSTTLSIVAKVSEGWTLNYDYTSFFNHCGENVEIKELEDGSVSFTLHADKGLKINAEDLSLVGIYTTPDMLPVLNINIDIPFSDVNKEEWVEARFELTLGTKEFESSEYIGMGEVKGRGNRSWKQPKKSYSIKLNEAFPLLDLADTRKYAIVANYDDRSMMKNYITYRAGALLNGIDYMPGCEFVDVYLNGIYNGVYLLVERIDPENEAFGMDEPMSMENMDGDVFIEKDINAKADSINDIVFDCPYWANQSKDCFVLKYPDLGSESEIIEAINYLNSYMIDVDNAIMGRSNIPYTQYIDVDSWVDFIIMQEISKNVDGNLKTSCYMYKNANSDKLYMATLWDFDCAYGGANWDNADLLHNAYVDCPTGTGVTDFMTINSSCPWFYFLYTNYPEFREAIENSYAEYRETVVMELKRLINEQAAYLTKASKHNSEVWECDFAKEVSDLKDWLNCRIDWLDGVWLDTIEIDFDFALNPDSGASFVSLQRAHDGYPFAAVIEDNRLCAVSCIEGKPNFESDMSLILEMNSGDELSFDYKISSEKEYDKFYFTVNGTTEHIASGESEWEHVTFIAPASGSYEFHWIYKKDYSGNAGLDCVFIDEVSIVSSNMLDYEIGDINLDGSVDSKDVIILSRYINNKGMLTQYALQFADVDDSGTIDKDDIESLFSFVFGKMLAKLGDEL